LVCYTQKKHNAYNEILGLGKTFKNRKNMNKEELIVFLEKHGLVHLNNDSYELSSDLLTNTMPISLGFENVAISQNKNICTSRLNTNIESEVFRGTYLSVPLIAANMSTVVDADFCIRLSKLGALGIMHRALPKLDYLYEVKKIADNCKIVAASIGVGEGQFDFARELIDHGANVIVIDIAHGYADTVIQLGKQIKQTFPEVKLVIGNTVNEAIMYEVADFADAVKIGVGQGLACETKNTAACTEKQFSAVLKFKQISKELGLPIISDGGIRESADAVKAIAAGANSVMAGSIFARCPESAGEIIEINGVRKKIYAGMASRRVQDAWRNGLKKGTCPEGKAIYIDLGEPVADLIERYSGALRSGITYAGATDINSFQENVRFVRLA
jgi:IMP dehydrogenase